MKFRLIIVLLCVIQLSAQADNPLVPDFGMADPHVRIFDGKAYLYTTRDADKKAKTFVMPDWHIWSSDDLVVWKHETTIKPTETYMGQSTRCWATDAVCKNGKYYFYFSNGNVDTGVMVGDSPVGPFKDALGKPMLPEDLTPTKEYDPTVLIDDDENETAYIAAGHHRDNAPDYYYFIARLNEDMISLAEAPKEIKITGDGKVLGGNDKPTLHKHNGIYYLSAGSHYATSDNVYGPYVKRGNSGNDEYGLNSRAHGNYFDWNNQSFHTWCHFHLGKDVARFRESYMTYLHYKDNGEMVSDVDFLDAHFATGVGQYDTGWDKIQAEWYMAASGVQKKECPNGGFEVQAAGPGGYICFPNVKQVKENCQITFYVSSESGGQINVYQHSSNGKLLGMCEISPTGGRNKYKEIACSLKNKSGTSDLYLKFSGTPQQSVFLDWFRFN